jgi:high-affinity Fe2+/Pb2+ permease
MTKEKTIYGLIVCLILVFIITLACFALFAQSDFSEPIYVILFMVGVIAVGLLCAIIWEIDEQT